MSLRQVVLTNLAIAHVKGIQMHHDRSVAPAVGYDKSLVAWDLCNHDVAVPNLGGQGTAGGPEEMRLSEITKANGQSLDLVVSVHNNAGYRANAPEINRVEHCFGYTNVAADSEVKLNFRFTKPGESAAWDPGSYVPYFKFTMLDLDQSARLQEQVIFHTDFDHLYFNESQPRDWHYDPLATPRTFTSMTHGNGLDNPDSPTGLNALQESRSFTVGFLGRAEWDVTFRTIGQSRGGRNFLWAGSSNIPDAMACEEWKDATFAWGLCDKTGEMKALAHAEMPTNNLGGHGPDVGDDIAKEIRYANVGNFNGNDLDLRVVADEHYEPYNISRNNIRSVETRNVPGLHGCYGAINVKSDSTVTLEFSFVNHGTNDVLPLGIDDGFGFTIYDIDRDEHTGAEEIVQFVTPYAHGDEHGAVAGEQVKNDGGRTFRALSNGNGKDNIYDPSEVDASEQMAKAVRVMYQGTGSWKVRFTAHKGTEGRNILFSGCSNMMEVIQ